MWISTLRKGQLVLLSLMATAAVLISVIIVSAILIREIKVSRDIDNATLALYGSEAALEQGLFLSRKSGQTPAQINSSGTYSNGVAWTLTASDKKNEIILDGIAKDQSDIVNLYDPARLNQSANADSLSISWTSGSNLNVSLRDWDGTTLGTPSAQNFACGGTTPCNQIIINSLATNRAYEITITAQNAAAIDVHVKAWGSDNASGATISIPIPTTIEGIATAGTSKQALDAALDQNLPWGSSTPPPPPPPPGPPPGPPGPTPPPPGPPPPVCPNNTVETGEQCDPPAVVSIQCPATAKTCSPSCQCITKCGNTSVEAGEQCDDGNLTPGDGCSPTCQKEPLVWAFVSNTASCSDSPTTLQLTNNASDPGMALGNYNFDFTGPVCSYINFTTQASLLATAIGSTGASDPNWPFVYISEQTGFGCGAHTMQIYDRRTHTIRTADISAPCTQINYTSGSYNPKQIAVDIATDNGWVPAPLAFTHVSHTGGCGDTDVVLNLWMNTGDPGMGLGNYSFHFPGATNTCSIVNYTTTGSIISSVASSTGANDPAWRFVYISEQSGFGCAAHTMQIYDRNTHTIRTGNITTPCSQINYSSGSYIPKQVAANIAAANGW